jgi:hypothetical protein
MDTTDLVTALPRAACARRLAETIGSVWTPSLLSSVAAVGQVDGDTFWIRKRLPYYNTFQPTLYGRLSDGAGGTRIHGEFKTLPLVPILIGAAAVILFAVGSSVAMIAARGVRLADIPLAALIAPAIALPLFAALGVGIVLVGRRLADNEKQFLVDFLKRTLEAR